MCVCFSDYWLAWFVIWIYSIVTAIMQIYCVFANISKSHTTTVCFLPHLSNYIHHVPIPLHVVHFFAAVLSSIGTGFLLMFSLKKDRQSAALIIVPCALLWTLTIYPLLWFLTSICVHFTRLVFRIEMFEPDKWCLPHRSQYFPEERRHGGSYLEVRQLHRVACF